MPEERELYRIAVKQPKATTYGIAGTCIVTNTRLILRWKNGKMEQYPFALIREVYSTKSTQPLFKKAVPAVEIVMFNGNREMFETPDSNASEIVSRIQDAMTPF